MSEEKRKYPNSDLRTSIVYPIYLTGKEIIRKYNEYLAEFDITYTQYLVLMYFYKIKSSNLKNIGKAMMLDSSTLTPLLKKLEKKGYIIRNKSTTDERNLQIDITPEALALQPKLRKVRSKIKNICNFTEEETETMHRLLYKLLDRILEENQKESKRNHK